MNSKSQIEKLFNDWNNALQTGNPKSVASLYDENDGVLLPTVSNQVRHNREEIEDYFERFLLKKPVGTIDESNVRIFGDLAINSGIYTFQFSDQSKVQARFTFVYRNSGSEWKIVEHHSSQMPEG